MWQQVSPLIITKKLKGIFSEVSYPNEKPVKQLFGHLTPQLLMKEMDNLSKLTGTKAMKDLTVVITHIKPTGNHEAEIKQQLQTLNKLQLHLMFPQQAQVFKL